MSLLLNHAKTAKTPVLALFIHPYVIFYALNHADLIVKSHFKCRFEISVPMLA